MSGTWQQRVIRTSNWRMLAWTLGLAGAVSAGLTFGFTVSLGLYADYALLYLTFVAAGLLGALVAAHKPRNSVAWLLRMASLAAVLFYLPLGYGYVAVVAHHDSWQLGGVAVLLAAWVWAPVMGLSLLTVRFPDGRVPRRWLGLLGSAYRGRRRGLIRGRHIWSDPVSPRDDPSPYLLRHPSDDWRRDPELPLIRDRPAVRVPEAGPVGTREQARRRGLLRARSRRTSALC